MSDIRIAFHQACLPAGFLESERISQSIGDDVGSILECFEDWEDPRSPVNRKHLLGGLIVIADSVIRYPRLTPSLGRV